MSNGQHPTTPVEKFRQELALNMIFDVTPTSCVMSLKRARSLGYPEILCLDGCAIVIGDGPLLEHRGGFHFDKAAAMRIAASQPRRF